MLERQQQTLKALTERILPSDGSDSPGAREAGVMNYFDWMMRQGFYHSHRKRIECGLEWVDAFSVARTTRPFIECSAPEQDSIISEMASMRNTAIQGFLDSVIKVTLAGFLCDPLYGGNKDKTGWKYIGFDWPGAAER